MESLIRDATLEKESTQMTPRCIETSDMHTHRIDLLGEVAIAPHVIDIHSIVVLDALLVVLSVEVHHQRFSDVRIRQHKRGGCLQLHQITQATFKLLGERQALGTN